jgi:hypothetical protein
MCALKEPGITPPLFTVKNKPTTHNAINSFHFEVGVVHSNTLAKTTTLHDAQFLFPATAQSNFYALTPFGYAFFTVTQISL